MAEIRDNRATRKVARSVLVIVAMRAAHASPAPPQPDAADSRAVEGDIEREQNGLTAHAVRHCRPWRALPMTMVAIGGTAIASGVAMVAMDQDPSPEGPRYIRDTARQGYIAITSGGVFAALGGYLYLRYGRGTDMPSHRSWIAPSVLMGGGATLVIVGTIWQLGTEPPNTFEQPRYLYNWPAIATIAAGGIAVSVGAYLGFKEPARVSGPIVSVSERGGIIGWTGTY